VSISVLVKLTQRGGHMFFEKSLTEGDAWAFRQNPWGFAAALARSLAAFAAGVTLLTTKTGLLFGERTDAATGTICSSCW
jgi:hypothetical protein